MLELHRPKHDDLVKSSCDQVQGYSDPLNVIFLNDDKKQQFINLHEKKIIFDYIFRICPSSYNR